MSLVPPSPRILGLGWALGIALIVGCIIIGLHLMLYKHPQHTLYLGTLFGIYALFLLIIGVFPKIQVGAPWPTNPPVVDGQWYWKMIFSIFMGIMGFGGALGGLSMWLLSPVLQKSL
ncbi:hypothetical protein EDD86DRAFT_246151 [Gorgonomyces haynaldii]|nr:hypothetical protein EDD86DRAFT_246151 [Gorgonomyces haynaldii]